MNVRPFFYVTFALCAALLAGAAPTHKLETAEGPPDGLAADVAAALDPQGHRVTGPDGTVCDAWFAATVNVRPNFRPTLMVKYPFTTGQLIGALRVAEDAKFTDFRGQSMKPGVYTLRYGQQPEDGNHIGTSDLADFLLALPAGADKSPEPLRLEGQLHQQSAQAAGTTHPAIFSLLPAEETEKPELVHDARHDYWILKATVSGRENDREIAVPIRLVVIGVSEH